jgi:glutathione S-transferase
METVRSNVVLHTFGPFLGTPDSSPFVIKTLLLLKLAGVAYREDRNGLTGAPRGLLPYIRDDGVVVTDSTHIRTHLERKYSIDFDAGLSAEQRAIGWAIEKMCEDHLYFALLDLRWRDRRNFRKGLSRMFKVLPLPLRPLARFVMRRRTVDKIRRQGMGLHDKDEIAALAIRDIEAISILLGTRPFLMGKEICGADASVFGFVTALLTPELSSPVIAAAMGKSNLIAYRDRIMQAYFGAERG